LGGKIAFNDVLVGEVWLASGQSNMGMPVRDSIDGQAIAKETNLPTLRFFQVPRPC
jgi:sialate O-acetylesterase